uniref:Uncharacterized protein n=1 Tax=Meloidogyne javanica TaxID=6303 RepID=A0A915MBT4_MELJA
MYRNIFKIIFPFILTKTIIASFCGKSGVPYSLEILANGAPVLGCAQPSCVISAVDENGEFQEDSQFLTDANGQSDGFFREGDRAVKRYRHPSGAKIVANCSGQFNELSCPRRNQWVGGIEYIDHPRQPLILQCCTFEGLRFSQEVGSTSIGPGEAITGGEVVRGGRQISFDVIANVRKIVKHGEGPEGSKMSYEVTVRRMNCLPDPPETEVEFDLDVASEVSKILVGAGNKEITDKLNEGKKQQQISPKFRNEKQKQKIEKLPEINGGGEGKFLAPNNVHPRIMAPSSRNLQQFIGQNSGNNIEELPPSQQQFQNLNNQQQFVEQQGFQQQQQQFPPSQQIPSQFVSEGQRVGEQVFQPQDGQQFPQQQFQQTSSAGGSFPQIPSDSVTQLASTPHPLFGLMSMPPHSFPTLPPHTFPTHSFPTLPPHTFPTHSFPTLPPHTFPSLPPHSFPTLPPHTFPPHSFPTLPPMFGVTTAATPTFGDSSGRAVAFAAPSVSASSSAGRTTFGQQSDGSQAHYNPHSPMRRDQSGLPTGHQSPPRMAPAMGTVLAAMQGDRFPIMHPVLGLIGYSNAPQPRQQVG